VALPSPFHNDVIRNQEVIYNDQSMIYIYGDLCSGLQHHHCSEVQKKHGQKKKKNSAFGDKLHFRSRIFKGTALRFFLKHEGRIPCYSGLEFMHLTPNNKAISRDAAIISHQKGRSRQVHVSLQEKTIGMQTNAHQVHLSSHLSIRIT
jgi:hypothetical protein